MDSRMGYYGVTQGEEAFYEWLPEREGLYEGAWIQGDRIPELLARYGQDFAQSQYLVNFGRVNYMRVFGSQWCEAWTAINGCRLKSWGINTLGIGVDNYPDEDWREFVKRTQIPYVLTLQHFPSTARPIFRDFPDVFAPEYEEKSREYARQLLPYQDDPLMIGYFMTNELAGFSRNAIWRNGAGTGRSVCIQRPADRLPAGEVSVSCSVGTRMESFVFLLCGSEPPHAAGMLLQ